MKVINHSDLTWRFLTWKGHPAGTNIACPKCCSNDHGSTPEEEESYLDFKQAFRNAVESTYDSTSTHKLHERGAVI